MSFVMRVVHENEDGTVIQLPWGAICDGCGCCVMDHLHVGGLDFCAECRPGADRHARGVPGLKVGDRVVYGPDPVARGLPESRRDIGTVIGFYDLVGVQYAWVDHGPGRNEAQGPVSCWTKIEEGA